MPVTRVGGRGWRGPTAVIVVAVQGLSARPLRSMLLVATLMLGVAAMACVSASSQVAHEAVIARAQLTGGVEPTNARELARPRRSLAVVRAILADHPSLALAATSELPARLGSAGNATAVRVVGVTGHLRSVKPFPVLRGRWLDEGVSRGMAIHLVLNAAAAKLVERHPTLAALTVGAGEGSVTPVIVGVTDDGGDQPTLYASLDELDAWFPAAVGRGSAIVYVARASLPLVDAVSRRVDAVDGTSTIFARTDTVATMRATVGSVHRIFSLIAAVALLVGAVAVLNIGLASLGERVDELALRRAVGTSPGLLAAMVLMEASIVSVIASAVALAVVVPVVGPAAHLLFADLPADTVIRFPASSAWTAIGSSLGAAFVGGLLPAFRASRIPIASVMRA